MGNEGDWPLTRIEDNIPSPEFLNLDLVQMTSIFRACACGTTQKESGSSEQINREAGLPSAWAKELAPLLRWNRLEIHVLVSNINYHHKNGLFL